MLFRNQERQDSAMVSDYRKWKRQDAIGDPRLFIVLGRGVEIAIIVTAGIIDEIWIWTID